MFVRNKQHLQKLMFGSINSLPEKILKRLEASWAGTFYEQVFVRIDEDRFGLLYSDKPSRPNIPVNVLVGVEILKSGFGWSDEEMYDHFCYDIQVRLALGYRDLSEGHFELRTMYNFRQRLTQHMQETGENLFGQVFEQISDEQLATFKLKTDKLRMDSTMIASNIRETTRVQLLVEVLQRVHRMLDETDQQRYAKELEPYLRGSSGQYIYHLKGEDIAEHLGRIGELMRRLVGELASRYGEEATYRVLQRVFQEHFIVDESTLRAKEGQELSASSMQSPDDWEATYRQKRGEKHRGYVVNVTETCNPENDLQLIVKVQTEPNNCDDAAMLDEVLPGLKERTGVEQMHTDGGYNSPRVDETMREQRVEQVQSAIRGGKPSEEKIGLEDFDLETGSDGQPQNVTCPRQKSVAVEPGRKQGRYCASFDASDCAACPFCDQCPSYPLKRTSERVLRFSQQEVDLALRRQRSADARASGQNLRAAVEATVRSIKHPFGNGKVPVRGKPRVSVVMIGSAAMSNVRRIHRYLVRQEEAERAEKRARKWAESGQQLPEVSLFSSFLVQLRNSLRKPGLFRPAPAYGF
ncbi:MAG: transposase [Anaerolineae bacterium]|nr:transposase [Anaerolineae bacterium]